MGHAQPLCKDITLGTGTLSVECPYGEIGDIGHFGITPSEARALDACIPNHESTMCMTAYDYEHVKSVFEQECLGKPNCSVELAPLIITENQNPLCVSNFAQFFVQVRC